MNICIFQDLFFFFSQNTGRQAYNYKDKSAAGSFLNALCSRDGLTRELLWKRACSLSPIQTSRFGKAGAAVNPQLKSLRHEPAESASILDVGGCSVYCVWELLAPQLVLWAQWVILKMWLKAGCKEKQGVKSIRVFRGYEDSHNSNFLKVCFFVLLFSINEELRELPELRVASKVRV